MLAISQQISGWLFSHYFVSLLGACIAIGIGIALANSKYGTKETRGRSPAGDSGFAEFPSPWFLVLLGLLLGGYFGLMLAWEDFTFFDGHYFYPMLAGGEETVPLQVFPNLGRLFPLGHQEFYLVSLLGKSAQTYQLFAAFEILLAGYLVTRVLRAHWAITLAVCAGILVTPPIVSATFHIIVPERNMLLLLCIVLWASVRYEQRPATSYLVLAGIAAFVFLQYKETAVVLIGLWAGYMILASWLHAKLGADQRRNLILLGGSLMAGCAIWLFVYVVAILPQIDHSYVEGRQHDSIDVLHAVVTNAWAYILAASILGRLLLARAGFNISPVWDGLPLAAIGSTAAYVALGFAHEYYYAPAALLAWLYAGKVTELAVESAGPERKTAAALGFAALAIVAALDAPTAFSDIYAPWKENVAAKADAARFIAGFEAVRKGETMQAPLRIVFPFNTDYEIAYFIGYLEAKYAISSIEVGMATDAAGSRTELCVRWMTFECHYGLAVRPGDLVVYFGEQAGRVDDLKGKYRLIHTSPDIGFWTNAFRVYVFQAP